MNMWSGFMVSGSVGFLMFFHIFMIMCNWTTLESGAFIGATNIFREQAGFRAIRFSMGEKWWQWLIPCGSPNPLQALDYEANISVHGVIDFNPDMGMNYGL